MSIQVLYRTILCNHDFSFVITGWTPWITGSIHYLKFPQIVKTGISHLFLSFWIFLCIIVLPMASKCPKGGANWSKTVKSHMHRMHYIDDPTNNICILTIISQPYYRLRCDLVKILFFNCCFAKVGIQCLFNNI